MALVRHNHPVTRFLALLAIACITAGAQAPFDIVISGGQVIDPESGLNDTRNVGITAGRVAGRQPGPARRRTSH